MKSKYITVIAVNFLLMANVSQAMEKESLDKVPSQDGQSSSYQGVAGLCAASLPLLYSDASIEILISKCLATGLSGTLLYDYFKALIEEEYHGSPCQLLDEVILGSCVAAGVGGLCSATGWPYELSALAGLLSTNCLNHYYNKHKTIKSFKKNWKIESELIEHKKEKTQSQIAKEQRKKAFKKLQEQRRAELSLKTVDEMLDEVKNAREEVERREKEKLDAIELRNEKLDAKKDKNPIKESTYLSGFYDWWNKQPVVVDNTAVKVKEKTKGVPHKNRAEDAEEDDDAQEIESEESSDKEINELRNDPAIKALFNGKRILFKELLNIYHRAGFGIKYSDSGVGTHNMKAKMKTVGSVTLVKPEDKWAKPYQIRQAKKLLREIGITE